MAYAQLPEKLVVSGTLAARLSNFYLPLVRILHVWQVLSVARDLHRRGPLKDPHTFATLLGATAFSFSSRMSTIKLAFPR